jgi:hypothetical protein
MFVCLVDVAFFETLCPLSYGGHPQGCQSSDVALDCLCVPGPETCAVHCV